MNKEILISIQSKHAINILNGKKTLELRTWIPKDYKGWVNVYITKSKPYIKWNSTYSMNGIIQDEWIFSNEKASSINGKVIFRFWFYGYETLEIDSDLEISTIKRSHEELLEKSCVDYNALNNMFMNENGDVFGYAWHIKQLEIFEKPKRLSDYLSSLNDYADAEIGRLIYEDKLGNYYQTLKNAPQKMKYIYPKL